MSVQPSTPPGKRAVSPPAPPAATPGQRAYEARIVARRTRLLCAGESAAPEPPAWHQAGAEHADWDAVVQAILGDAFPGLKRDLAEARRERDEARAALSLIGQPLSPNGIDSVYLHDLSAQDPDMSDEEAELHHRIDLAREALGGDHA